MSQFHSKRTYKTHKGNNQYLSGYIKTPLKKVPPCTHSSEVIPFSHEKASPFEILFCSNKVLKKKKTGSYIKCLV